MAVNPVVIGKDLCLGKGAPLVFIAGPCVIESRELTLAVAEQLADVAQRWKVPLIFKASFDKANRSSVRSFRGPGLEEGLRVLEEVKRQTHLPVTTDVHWPQQASLVAEVADLLQVPAFLARQTDLIMAVAATGRPLNVKKAQFMAPWEMKNVVEKAEQSGNSSVVLTERGTMFGYGRLVNDMRSIAWMQEIGCPVVFDATHSVQLPAGSGDRSHGERKFIRLLARCAVAAGCDGLFIETHPDPDRALSDGPNMLPLSEVSVFIGEMLRIRQAYLETQNLSFAAKP